MGKDGEKQEKKKGIKKFFSRIIGRSKKADSHQASSKPSSSKDFSVPTNKISREGYSPVNNTTERPQVEGITKDHQNLVKKPPTTPVRNITSTHFQSCPSSKGKSLPNGSSTAKNGAKPEFAFPSPFKSSNKNSGVTKPPTQPHNRLPNKVTSVQNRFPVDTIRVDSVNSNGKAHQSMCHLLDTLQHIAPISSGESTDKRPVAESCRSEDFVSSTHVPRNEGNGGGCITSLCGEDASSKSAYRAKPQSSRTHATNTFDMHTDDNQPTDKLTVKQVPANVAQSAQINHMELNKAVSVLKDSTNHTYARAHTSQEEIPKKKMRPRSGQKRSNSHSKEEINRSHQGPQQHASPNSRRQNIPATLYSKSTSSLLETSHDTPAIFQTLASQSTDNMQRSSKPVMNINPQIISRDPSLLVTTQNPTSSFSTLNPPVIHYHLNIQNCDGLSIHTGNGNTLMPVDVSIENSSEIENIPWNTIPLATSTLRKERLALHDQLTCSDQESDTDSMKPLNLDDTISDMTADTTALVELDAWRFVKDMNFNRTTTGGHLNHFENQPTTSNIINSNQYQNSSRLSRSNAIPGVSNHLTFNPPWRQQSRGTYASSEINRNAQSTNIRSNSKAFSQVTVASQPKHRQTETNSPCEQTMPISNIQCTSSNSIYYSNSKSTGTQCASLSRCAQVDSKKVPKTESTGTQYPSLQRGKHQRSSFHVISSVGTKPKPVAKVAPQTRADQVPIPTTRISRSSAQIDRSLNQSSHHQEDTQGLLHVTTADSDAMLVQYLLDNPPDFFSETTETISVDEMSISSGEDFELTDDEASITGQFSRHGLGSTIQPTLRRTESMHNENELHTRTVTLEEMVASIRNDIIRVPGVLIVTTRRNRIVVHLSHVRPNLDGVRLFMAAHGISEHDYECEILPWRNQQQQQQHSGANIHASASVR